ncbi:MAG: SusC/RagA family TonB-linked outer membrane protein [Adhaeribacter sp.]
MPTSLTALPPGTPETCLKPPGPWRLTRMVGLFSLLSLVQLSALAEEQKVRPVPGKDIPAQQAGKSLALPVTGVVKDSQNQPLPGVSIRVKDTSQGTITDTQGRFSLEVPNAEAILVFSYIGFDALERKVGNTGQLDIVLRESSRQLNDVVVVGYGQVTKSDLTGAVGQVEMKDLAKAPVGSFTEALAGRVAGVQVSSNSGQPGSEPEIIIRGTGSLTQSNAPLYVVDGFPLENFEGSSLNPNDIESITVLKDASATAIYGARAANGVIVVETKKGKTGKPVLTFNSTNGIQKIRKQMEMMSPYEFVKYQTELNPAVGNLYLAEGKTLDYYKNVEGINWQDHLFRSAPIQMYNLALRGGSESTKYAVSASLNDHDAVIINTGFKRHQARVSLDQDLNKKLKVGIIASYSNAKSFGIPAALSMGTSNPTNFLFMNAWGYRPVTPNDESNLLEDMVDEDVISANVIRINPVITAQNTNREVIDKTLTASFYFTYALRKDLTLKVMASNNTRNVRSNRFNNSLTAEGSPRNPTNTRGINGTVSFSEVNTWSNENTLTYNKTLGKHKVNLLGGYSMQGSKSDAYGLGVNFLPNEELGMPGFEEGTPASVSAAESRWGLMSFFGRINYGYKSRYLLTFTGRADGSSKFAPGSKWGYFPSGAFAWNLHEEDFLKDLALVSNAKLRMSYGITGNNRVDDFAYLSRISFPLIASVHYNNSEGEKSVVLNSLGNADLKWESTALADIGLDLGILSNRIEFTTDLYQKTTRDLLLNADMPYMTGYSKAYKNIGTVRNEGIEFGLNTTNIHSPSFTWESSFNISFNRSKVLALTKGQQAMFSNTVLSTFYDGTPLWIAEVGQPVARFHGYIWDGVYQYEDFDNPSPGVYILKNSEPTNGNVREAIRPGDVRYRDLNADGVVNSFDQTVIGRAQPIHTGGFSNNFTYKAFSVNAFFQWSYGNQIYNGNRLILDGNANINTNTNQFASYVDRWTPENPTSKNFRAGGQGPFGIHSTRVLEDGSYLRLKTLSVAYRIPSQYTRLVHMSNLSVTASAQNLLTWTRYSGMDPEVSVRNSALTPGFDYSAYPHARTMVFGVNATF